MLCVARLFYTKDSDRANNGNRNNDGGSGVVDRTVLH